VTIRFIIPSVFINKLDCSVCTGLTQVLSDQYRHSSLVCVYVRLLKSGDQCLQAVSVKNTPYSSSICLIFWALIIIIIIVIITIIIIIIIIISFTQCIYTYIPDTNYVPRECSVAAILLLLFMVLIPSVSVFNLLYFYISTFRSMCAVPNMAVFCSSFTSCFPGMLLTYFLNGFVTVPVAPIITGITFVFTFHMRCISVVRSLYFRIFSASFLNHISVS